MDGLKALTNKIMSFAVLENDSGFTENSFHPRCLKWFCDMLEIHCVKMDCEPVHVFPSTKGFVEIEWEDCLCNFVLEVDVVKRKANFMWFEKFNFEYIWKFNIDFESDCDCNFVFGKMAREEIA